MNTDKGPRIPDRVEQLITGYAKLYARFVDTEEFKEQTPMLALFGRLSEAKTNVLFVPEPLVDNRNALVAILREILRDQGADFLLFSTEAWTVTAKGEEELRAVREYERAHHGSIVGHPNASEVLMVTLELKNGAYYTARAPLLPGRHVGEWEIDQPEHVEGRLTGLFLREGERLQ